MSVPALLDDVNPEAPVQLVLTEDAFNIERSLWEVGVLKPVALDFTALGRDLTYDEFELLASYFGIRSRQLQWYMGDLLNEVENKHGEEFAQVATVTGLAEQTLLNRMSVCKAVPEERRRPALPFSVHAEVAKLSGKDQKKWLDRAEKGGWTRAELRTHMKATRTDEKPPELPSPGEVQIEQLIDAARSLLAHADDAGENVVVRKEDVARLSAALGIEE